MLTKRRSRTERSFTGRSASGRRRGAGASLPFLLAGLLILAGCGASRVEQTETIDPETAAEMQRSQVEDDAAMLKAAEEDLV